MWRTLLGLRARSAPEEIDQFVEQAGRFVTNKRDFDYSVTLFEWTAEGKYVQLNYHRGRARYARDRRHRVLLSPDKQTTLAFESNRLTSRRISPGSRIVVVVAVMKSPSQQINYGTGKLVADETIRDAGEKLRIRWLTGTYVDVPFSPVSSPAQLLRTRGG